MVVVGSLGVGSCCLPSCGEERKGKVAARRR
uniref:Uncharacterized protein n=1 Tax=Arundo donax TaxID=35708 RepID=A0A0A9L4Z7_ARUDO